MTFGIQILSISKQLNWLLGGLAKKVSTSVPIIVHYALGEIKPSIGTAKNIVAELNITFDFILCDNDMIIDKELLHKVMDVNSFTKNEKPKSMF